MSLARDRSYRWVFYTSAAFLFGAAVLRSPLVIEDRDVLLTALLLLLGWLVLFVTEAALSRLWPPWFTVYLALQTAIVVALLFQPGSNDFFAVLFGVLAMHALQGYGPRLGSVWILLFIPLTALPLLENYDPGQVGALVLIYTALNLLLGSYALVTRRASEARSANQALGEELQAANTELESYSRRLERLAVAQERNRLARQLHDSVSQAMFGILLAARSAQIMREKDPDALRGQLQQLQELTQDALTRMRGFIADLRPKTE